MPGWRLRRAALRVLALLLLTNAWGLPLETAAADEGANALAVAARQYFEAAALETDPIKRLELLLQANADLEAIVSAHPNDAYAARIRAGEPVLGMTRGALDESIAALIRGPAPAAQQAVSRAGRYFILLDADRKPLLAAYWIGDDVIGVVTGAGLAGIVPETSEALVVDRYLFPRAAIDAPLLLVKHLEYAALPDGYDEPVPGKSFTVEARLRSDVLGGANGKGTALRVAFAWGDRLTRDVDGTTLEAYAFTATNLPDIERDALPIDAAATERVYVPSLGFGVGRRLWDRIAHVVAGTAPSSADLAFAVEQQADLTDTSRSCLAALRSSDGYARYQAGLAALEGRSEALMAQGLTDTLTYGIAPYADLEKQYGIIARFQACRSG